MKGGFFLQDKRLCIKGLCVGLIALMLTAAGGAPAAAARPAAALSDTEKGVLAGLVVVGLVYALDRSSDDGAPGDRAGGGGAAPQEVVSPQVKQALALLNGDRARYGLAPLRHNESLARLADDYAGDMIERGFFSHTNPEGETPFDRMDRYGVAYRYAGENLAVNSSVESAEQAFMNSPTHRDNILSADFTEVGIGVRYDESGRVYVVQEFIGR